MGTTCLDQHQVYLGEGSMYERLRRSGSDAFDPFIAHSAFLFEDQARDILADTHREYLDIGQKYGLPMIAGTPTWRASAERIARSRHAGQDVNGQGVQFMRALRDDYGPDAQPIVICGVIGPKGDGYLPGEAPTASEAELFHRPQIEALTKAGVDYLAGFTLPNAQEALGIAREMARTDLPFQISFVLRPDGTLLDGSSLSEVIDQIDNETSRPPHSYAANCVHASVFASAMRVAARQNPRAAGRVTELNANTSAKTPEELEGLEEIDTEDPRDFGTNLARLYAEFGTRSLGGCCGSSTEHIEALAVALTTIRP